MHPHKVVSYQDFSGRDGPEGQKAACHHADDGARDRRATSDVLTSSVIAIAADEAAMLLLFMLTLTANSAQHLTQPRCVSAERTTVPGME